MEVSDPTTIYCDKLNNIQLAKNLVYHFVREHVLSGEVQLQYVPMDRQNANIFTKPLGLDKLRQFLGALGLRQLDIPNLRGSKGLQDHKREQERSGSDRDAESGDKFDFGSVGEAEVDPRKSLKADVGAAFGRESRSQLSMGEMKATRKRRPSLRTNWRQPIPTKSETNRRQPI